MIAKPFRAVFFDFGGVITTSPFEAFERYERANQLPVGLIRDINATNPDDNAWAKLERGHVDMGGFIELFESEAEERGHAIDGRAVIGLLAGRVRPVMVSAIETIKAAGLVTACLTNNFQPHRESGAEGRLADERRADIDRALAMFDFVVESSVVGVRKPEPAFYREALRRAEVEATETVFLDDLGINLKQARAMGMTTIKVVDPLDALGELQELLSLDLI